MTEHVFVFSPATLRFSSSVTAKATWFTSSREIAVFSADTRKSSSKHLHPPSRKKFAKEFWQMPSSSPKLSTTGKLRMRRPVAAVI